MWTRLGMAGMIVVAACGVASACDKEAKSQVKSRFVVRTAEAGEHDERAYFGIQLGAAEDGIRIIEVIDDSPAEEAGFEAEDVIISFGGQDIDGVEHFVKIVGNSEPGDDVLVEYDRDGVTRSRTITLGSRNDMPQAFSFSFGHGGESWVPEEFAETLKNLQGGNISVDVNCEDGKGTATIERDGEVIETHEFDCDEAHGQHMNVFKWRGGDEEGAWVISPEGAAVIDLDGNMEELHERLKGMEIELGEDFPHAMIHRGHFLGKRDRAPTIRFREDSDGRIEVSIRKGDTELIKEFRDASDLERREPDLFEKYDDLQN